jgi:signal transduction histidine kinase
MTDQDSNCGILELAEAVTAKNAADAEPVTVVPMGVFWKSLSLRHRLLRSQALLTAGLFTNGGFFAIGKPKHKPQTNSASGAKKGQTEFAASVFFDAILEIDSCAKVLTAHHGTHINAGSVLLERIHIADRPLFMLACHDGAKATRNVTVRIQAEDPVHFVQAQFMIKPNGQNLLVAIRHATDISTNADSSAGDAQRELARELAHELRTPLAAMVGLADALAHDKTCTQEMHKTYPALIASTGRSLIELTGTMLQSPGHDVQESGASSGQVASLGQVVQECVALWQPMAAQKSIVLFDRVPKMLAAKTVESAAMRQILTNLISNAVKYCPNGTSVEVGAATSANAWTLTVADNGSGLAPEDVARLGQKNFRSDRATGTAGYGLGLFIVRRLVDAIGGRISFESRPGKGTKVMIAFTASRFANLSDFQPQAGKAPVLQHVLMTTQGDRHAAA